MTTGQVRYALTVVEREGCRVDRHRPRDIRRLEDVEGGRGRRGLRPRQFRWRGLMGRGPR